MSPHPLLPDATVPQVSRCGNDVAVLCPVLLVMNAWQYAEFSTASLIKPVKRCRSTLAAGHCAPIFRTHRMGSRQLVGPVASVRPLSILVAEDTRELQALITSWLEEAGHTVKGASSGRQLLQQAQEQPFDLLVT